MNMIDTLYEDENLSTNDGIDAICEKINNLNVSLIKYISWVADLCAAFFNSSFVFVWKYRTEWGECSTG